MKEQARLDYLDGIRGFATVWGHAYPQKRKRATSICTKLLLDLG